MKNKIAGVLCRQQHLLLGILTATAVTAVAWNDRSNSQQMFALLFVIAFSSLYRVLPLPEDRRVRRAATVLAILFAGATCLGSYEALGLVRETRQHTTEMLRLAFVAPISFFGLYVLYVRLVGRVLDWLCGEEGKEQDAALEQRTKRGERRAFFMAAGLFLCASTIALFAEFPGGVNDDVYRQLQEVVGVHPLTNYNPLIQTLFMIVGYRLGMLLFGTSTAAVAVCTIGQMLFMCLVIGYTFAVLYRLGVKRGWMTFWLCCLLFYPCHAWQSVTLWKDVPFALLMLLFAVRLYLMLHKPVEEIRAVEWIAFVVIGVLVCLFRVSGLAAVVVSGPFLLYAFRKRMVPAVISCVGLVGLALAIQGPIYSAVGIPQSDVIEASSIPLQQIGRVLHEEREISPEQEAIISEIFDIERARSGYKEYISDPIKGFARDKGSQPLLEKDPMRYIRVWLQIGLKHPDTYVEAWVEQTRGYWDPLTDCGPLQYGCYNGGEYEILDYDAAPITMIGRKLTNWILTAPLLGIVVNVALHHWLLLILAAYAILKRRTLIPLLPVWINTFMILIGTPVATQFRYGYNLILVVPFLLLAYGAGNGRPVQKAECSAEKPNGF